MPVAISFCVYSLWQYIKRADMIRRKDPGPCEFIFKTVSGKKKSFFPVFISDEDDVGPVVLAWMLASAIVVNFAIKLYDLAT